ncbi:class I SAM-dependent methyltransferase [Streptomyces sp. SID11385]|uniref:class I SAM-dependent methyltransferase n=1 Tax=Streptomyces sp. SID11385 TaxID=2706031 RepID=UPI0013CA261B|nr:class I SAM-dependent methyltransferase [Streptomyces sp. SID11385]NEA43017.1 class I SAM-dependent methyltransferase [Streptomyces sp. SID11385]
MADEGTTTAYRPGYGASGPGALTPDGCAVELYKRLPVRDEPDVIASVAPPGARLLELGCGAGRVTRPLVARGFDVTAVDESAAMLAEVRGARTVCSPIERLDLGETFPVVLLASFLVHAGDAEVRRGLLRTCRRHLAPGGSLLLQREPADAHDGLPRERRDPGHTTRIVSSVPYAEGVRQVRAEYVFADATWTQTFLSRPLDDEGFAGVLAEEGLRAVERLSADGVWWRAVAA